MKIFSAIRSHEWWGYKLPPLLAVAYAAVVRSNGELYAQKFRLLYLLCSLVAGAVYVSLINDLTDLDEDRRSGKRNRMEALPVWQRYGLLAVSLGAGAFFFTYFAGDAASTVFYTASWVAFTLYSVPPFRLKKRGFWGVLADACGAHLFPSLLLLSAMTHALGETLSPLWLGSVAAWSFCYGLRGILWHQFSDRREDRVVGLKTFATSVEPERFRRPALLLFIIELLALAVMLWCIGKALPFIFLASYVLILVAYSYVPGMQFLIVLPAPRPPYHILMSSFYQILFPVSLLLTDAVLHRSGYIILILHLLLFPRNIKRLVSDMLRH